MNRPESIIGTLMDIQIIEDIYMTVPWEDWSKVRSPGRARRRLKRGFKQNIKIIQIPSEKIIMMGRKAIMHPEKAKEILKRIAEHKKDC